LIIGHPLKVPKGKRFKDKGKRHKAYGIGKANFIKARPLKNIQFCSKSRQAKILTTGIHRVFRGLKFEPNDEIEPKRVFFKGLG